MEYETIRAFLPNATFEKDTLVSESGSKGDFIYRETDSLGSPFLSVMFEMKTEDEASKYKHKNENFFKELDKDRCEKNCEYAVLVTTLEAENDYYNRGIVDVSHKYPKMLVIRPQFFLPLLMLLRSVAEDKINLQKKIEDLENEQFNALTLERDLGDFKDAILKCHSLATSNRDRAVKRIDNAIKLLEETKEDLIKMDKHFDSAKKKSEKVTLQKLKKKHPAVFTDDDDGSCSNKKGVANESEAPASSTESITDSAPKEQTELRNSA